MHFTTKLLDKKYWKHGRDFGLGFYTTHLIEQPKPWAIKSSRKRASEEGVSAHDYVPCILNIAWDTGALNEAAVLLFSDASREWARFILDHRLQSDANKADPCNEHPDIVVGYMADNDTGDLVSRYLYESGFEFEQFFEGIQISEEGNKMTMDGLGNQYAFCNEALDGTLKVTGCHILEGGEWIYYGIDDPHLSELKLL
ncbi:DUF3990 domain-containing protein [Paenibacillus sp. MMS18-CY102]|uniref:DUF3990 domain-containing protein n=1 Tax=Paenibacillus sp. MMS18-CY102 TaxID=2682849 RepID=UPI001F3528C2|nr:DUF3990 domain-containing protein [Paenibacillus sp. MMS18-CY102]